MAFVRTRAGLDLRGPYCFCSDFFVLNDHCLNMPQNSPNLEYSSHLPKMFRFYCRCEFLPLGVTIIKESVFWLKTHIYFVAYSKTSIHLRGTPRWQHAPTCVDWEGTFVAACSFNYRRNDSPLLQDINTNRQGHKETEA